MLKSFNIKSSTKTYKIIFSKNHALNYYENTVLLVDQNLKKKIKHKKNCIFIPAKEENKSYHKVSKIIKKLIKLGVNRRTTILAIGGGIIQDIACFISSVFMRGIDWIYLPSTLLGMTDSCIGGKSSINFYNFKNIKFFY